MSDDPKARAEAGLLRMVDQALAVIESSLASKAVPRGQQTRSSDAWRVLDAVMQIQSGGALGVKQPVARLNPEEAMAELQRRGLGAKR